MGAAAQRRREDGHDRPSLRLVPREKRARTARATGRAHASDVAACRRGFQIACLIMATIFAVGMVRVELSVRAAEAALTTTALREQIAAERQRNESLESRRLALESPGRIESIATATMGMSAASGVSYIDVPASPPVLTVSDSEPRVGGRAGLGATLSSVLARIAQVTVGTRQVTLASDAGFASSR